MGRIDWIENGEPVLEQQMTLEETIQYLHFRADTSGIAHLLPQEAAELAQYIEQLRAINVTLAESLASDQVKSSATMPLAVPSV